MQANLESGIELESQGQTDVGSDVVLQHNINMVNAFLQDLSRLNDRARIIDDRASPGPVTVKQVVELSAERGPSIPAWQTDTKQPIFSVLKAAMAYRIRKATDRVRDVSIFGTPSPTQLGSLPPVPKKAAVIKKQKAAAEAVAAAIALLLDKPRAMGRFIAFQAFAVTMKVKKNGKEEVINLTQQQRKNLCLHESTPAGCRLCEYGDPATGKRVPSASARRSMYRRA
jgi:hypothetical protein